jgi:uncharacterized protein DUF177 involved in 23S rRNA accumulation
MWEHATHEVPEAGLTREREASTEELADLARALDLLACRSLRATYSIVPTIDGRYRLSGTLRADISQACVVTLDPVDCTLEETFEATFWPQEDMPAPRGGEVGLDEEPDPEPIVAGQIAVGRMVFECLASAIDPFPRRPDAILDRHSAVAANATESPPEGPFAALANIKPKA